MQDSKIELEGKWQFLRDPGQLLGLLILLALCYRLLFFQLDSYTFRSWDESLYALNASQMLETGNPIVKYSKGRPDMWNVKPPLVVWFQALSMKVFGRTPLAVRLPVAFAALSLILLLFQFGRRQLGSYATGLIAALVLLCSPGFVAEHGSRTGDHDVPLALFSTIFLLYFYLYIEKGGKMQHLVLAISGIIAASLTKGVLVLLFLPGLVLSLLWLGKLKQAVLDKNIWLGVAAYLLVVLGYYFLRESMNPGYLQAVWDNELGGRFGQALEGHQEEFWHYWGQMSQIRFVPWIYFLLPALLLIFGRGSKARKRMGMYLVPMILAYFFLISSAQTKLFWYDIPLMPLLAILLGIGLDELYQLGFAWAGEQHPWLGRAVALVLGFCLFSYSFFAIQEKNRFRKELFNEQAYGYFLPSLEPLAGDGMAVLEPEPGPSLELYLEVAAFERGKSHKMLHEWMELQPGMKVMVCREDMKEALPNHVCTTTLGENGPCMLVEVLSLQPCAN